MRPDDFRHWLRQPKRQALVMGVLNVTPDSFSDGGKYALVDAAVAHGRRMVDAGAGVLDIGGESTRPGSMSVPPDEQIRRIRPVIEQLRDVATLSVDTRDAAVARAALDAGARLINDISAGTADANMLPLAIKSYVPFILMHMRGEPATMQVNPQYGDVMREVMEYLAGRAQVAMDMGMDRSNILIDPGIGFGKTDAHNLELLRRLNELEQLGYPIVVGTSRKAFIGRITGEGPAAENRLFGTAATVAWSMAHGASLLRVHDVEQMVYVVRMARAIVGD
ncbi:MAG: dihydropteroate synthase [Phycisphaerales bacterium]|jgi:dihydropteroate synthase|nr:dihydropteroate synthase [Phycisphaerales bacterium]